MILPKTIGFEIKILSNLIKRNSDDVISENRNDGVTSLQSWIISYIMVNAERSVFQRDIERDFNIRRATVTGILQLMERNGLIIRKPVGYDARLKMLTLTPKAEEFYESAVQQMIDFEKKLCNGISAEEIAFFHAIMDKMRKNLE